MKQELRTQLLALGQDLSPAMLQGTTAVMASIAAPPDPSIEILRDLQYGPDARNRLDVFRRGRPTGVPVLVYVHGGGFVMGGAGALLLRTSLKSQLFGVGAGDPVVISVVAALLLAVALLACALPARRAARIDPIAALSE